MRNSMNFCRLKMSSRLFFSEKISDIFEFLLQINSWLEQIKTDDLYLNGIRQILEVNILPIEILLSELSHSDSR